MRVLVTGGTGLVGKAIQAVRDSNEYFFASSIDGDLRDLHAARKLFTNTNPEWVIHLAARVGGVFANMAHNIEFFEDNLAINRNVVTLCHEWKVQRAVFCLSTCVFPENSKLPLIESQLHAGPPHASNEGYAYAKRMLECHVRFCRETYGYSHWICVSPTNVYGPFDNFHDFNSHVIPGLIRRCEEAVETWVVFGSGTPKRQFIYSRDLARIILKLLESDEDMGHHVICADSPTASELTISELASLVAELMDFKGVIVFDSSMADGIAAKTVSNEHLMKCLPDTRFTPLREGLIETCTWFKTVYKIV